jgi:hypothetical protein
MWLKLRLPGNLIVVKYTRLVKAINKKEKEKQH